jgi:phosphoglycolate phosphatase
MEKYKLNEKETIMIGARKYDIIGANKNRIDSIGYYMDTETRKSLENEFPKYLCNSTEDILRIVR